MYVWVCVFVCVSSYEYKCITTILLTRMIECVIVSFPRTAVSSVSIFAETRMSART